MKKIKNLIKEPLLLFFLLGTISFILYTQATTYIEKKNKQITISESQIELLKESFKKTRFRNPTQNELDAQLDNYVMDEIFYREAVAMGLDKTDPAVKRRLRQVLELMMDDYTTIYPTENQLRKCLSENPDKFRKEPSISFRHLYFPFANKEEAIDLLQRAYCRAGKDAILISSPTYGMYQVCAAIQDAGVVDVPLTANYQLDVAGICAHDVVKLIFIWSSQFLQSSPRC